MLWSLGHLGLALLAGALGGMLLWSEGNESQIDLTVTEQGLRAVGSGRGRSVGVTLRWGQIGDLRYVPPDDGGGGGGLYADEACLLPGLDYEETWQVLDRVFRAFPMVEMLPRADGLFPLFPGWGRPLSLNLEPRTKEPRDAAPRP